jgi:uncharacterized DUF497 family protein
MKFVKDDKASLWLRDFIPDSDNFDWDAGNRTKNSKHAVQCAEIESVFYQEKFIFAGRITDPAHEDLFSARATLDAH